MENIEKPLEKIVTTWLKTIKRQPHKIVKHIQEVFVKDSYPSETDLSVYYK